jgi:aspartate racemase
MTERVVAKHESEVPEMKRIGVIGGMGQWASLDILERIYRLSREFKIPQYGNRGYPPIDISIINKAPMLLNDDGSYPDKLEPSPTLLEAARFVGENSDFLIVTSNTAHIFRDQIEKAAGKSLLSIIDVTMDDVKQRRCNRVGVIAIGLILGLFQAPLEEAGVESVFLPENMQKELEDEGIYPIQEGATVAEVNKVAFTAVDYFRDQKVDGIILGCTEIPILLGTEANAPDIINPSQLLAEAAIKRSLGKDS